MENTDNLIRNLLEDSKKYQEDLIKVLTALAMGLNEDKKGEYVLLNQANNKTAKFNSLEEIAVKTGINLSKIQGACDTGEALFGTLLIYDNKSRKKSEKAIHPKVVEHEHNYSQQRRAGQTRYRSVTVKPDGGKSFSVPTITQASDILGCNRQTLRHHFQEEGDTITYRGHTLTLNRKTLALP